MNERIHERVRVESHFSFITMHYYNYSKLVFVLRSFYLSHEHSYLITLWPDWRVSWVKLDITIYVISKAINIYYVRIFVSVFALLISL